MVKRSIGGDPQLEFPRSGQQLEDLTREKEEARKLDELKKKKFFDEQNQILRSGCPMDRTSERGEE